MSTCLFVADLHGRPERYRKLFRVIRDDRPAAVFLGGDLLPSGWSPADRDEPWDGEFATGFLSAQFETLRDALGQGYPRVFVILGNDDPRSEEEAFLAADAAGLWEYVHGRHAQFGRHDVYGYAYVPPTPFLLKDWERYDVSRHVDPGCVSPEAGHRTIPVAAHEVRYATITEDLETLVGNRSLDQAILLFHAPPYRTRLDRAALDGKSVDHAPVDVHVGSVAIRRLIEERRPLITLHGHIHESARLTGAWLERIGRTYCYSAAHDGPELALVRFDPDDPGSATRALI